MEFETAVEAVCAQLGLDYHLKEEQKNILCAITSKKDVFGLLPTGYGKSHCFGLAPLVMDKMYPNKKHIALVISPLKSLMNDLVARYMGMGISSVAILRQEEMSEEDICDLTGGNFSLVFSSPEAILNDRWWKVVDQWRDRVCCFAVDEAHCMTTWGKDFRLSYQRVVEVRTLLPDCPVLALTATATQKMVSEILECLHLDKDTLLIAVLPDRPNIFLQMKKVSSNIPDNFKWVADEIREKGNECPKSLIYAQTVDHATQIWGALMRLLKNEAWVNGDKSSQRLRVELYHGSTDPEKQKSILRRFTSEDSLKVVVATVAFGMGVQVDNVEKVVHWGPSRATLDYWQEIGRCARDGRLGTAFLYIPPRSNDPRLVSQEIVDIVKSLIAGNVCMRKAFLQHLFVEGMSTDQLDSCSTSNPRCCSNCQ